MKFKNYIPYSNFHYLLNSFIINKIERRWKKKAYFSRRSFNESL